MIGNSDNLFINISSAPSIELRSDTIYLSIIIIILNFYFFMNGYKKMVSERNPSFVAINHSYKNKVRIINVQEQ